MSQSSCGQTSVRLPCWMFTIPSIASACTVSRATVRLTPYRVTISSDDGNASPTPMRPDTISAASSVESCWLSRWGSRSTSLRRGRCSADNHAVLREREIRKVPFQQHLRRAAERACRRPERVVLEHASADEDLLGAGVVVVDRVLHLEHEHREDLAQPVVRERVLAGGLRLVHGDENVDQVDS